MKLPGGTIIQFCQFPIYKDGPGLQVLFEFLTTNIYLQWISSQSIKILFAALICLPGKEYDCCTIGVDMSSLNVEIGKSTVVSNGQRPSAIS